MSDEERQAKRRKLMSESKDSIATLNQATIDAQRYAQDPYAGLLGTWVLGIGVREHARGRLDHVDYFPGGARMVFLDGIFHIDDFDDASPNGGQGEKRLPGPAILQESGFIWWTPQPKAWPKTYSS